MKSFFGMIFMSYLSVSLCSYTLASPIPNRFDFENEARCTFEILIDRKIQIKCGDRDNLVVPAKKLLQRLKWALSRAQDYTSEMSSPQINIWPHKLDSQALWNEEKKAETEAKQIVFTGINSIDSGLTEKRGFENTILLSFFPDRKMDLRFRMISTVVGKQIVEIQNTLVTQFEFFEVMGYNPSYFSSAEYCKNDFLEVGGVGMCANHPVDSVSWDEAKDFIDSVNANSARYTYSLPSVKNWSDIFEHELSSVHWRERIQDNPGPFIWTKENSHFQSHPVASKIKSPSGFHDIVGNLWQWTNDGICTNGNGCKSQGEGRLMVGGCWNSSADRVLKKELGKDRKSEKSYCIGFRVLRKRK